MCTAVFIGWDPQTTPYPPALGLVYEGTIGQQRYTTSLCNPRKLCNEKQSFVAASSGGWGRRFGFLQSSGRRSRLAKDGQVQTLHLCHRAQAQQVIPDSAVGRRVSELCASDADHDITSGDIKSANIVQITI